MTDAEKALLDAAADERGDAYIEGVGARVYFTRTEVLYFDTNSEQLLHWLGWFKRYRPHFFKGE